jgi:D-tyrosyl-tRNA(Tyr) deacylase
MRAVVQRVHGASVEVDGAIVGSVARGLCAFVGAGRDDAAADVAYVAGKVAGLRVFPDESGRMSLSVADVGGGVLVVSQFTLYGDVRRGRRPSFDAAMDPEAARASCDALVARLREHGLAVATGRFAAMMRVRVDNDGPVTILIDSKKQF